MSSELTWRQAIEQVLSESSTPLHYNDITERIISQGLRKSLGATPASSVNAQISASIKHEKQLSPFVKISQGTFAMRSSECDSACVLEDTENQYDIFTSFGMFWRRSEVRWTRSPKLLGTQAIGATTVDFYGQAGVYLLYDGREVIYVGRSTNLPLGMRLFEHTLDRLSARWDRFSWFGLLPVSDTGKIGSMPAAYSADNLIPALEAILIEALEPRQNRKRGDDLSGVEYIQYSDPEIEKKRVITFLTNNSI